MSEEEEIFLSIVAFTENLKNHMNRFEELTGSRLAIVLNDGGIYSEFSGCSIRELFYDDEDHPDEYVSEDSIAVF
jgi:hypothetical protein